MAASSGISGIKSTHVNLTRLLKRCTDMVETSRGGVLDRDRHRFETYLKTLRGLLDDLRVQTTESKDSPKNKDNAFEDITVPLESELAEYTRKIDYLTEFLNEKELGNPQNTLVSTNIPAAEYQTKLRVRQRQEQDLRNELFAGAKGFDRDSAKREKNVRWRGTSSGHHKVEEGEEMRVEDVDRIMMDQRKEQEDLSADLLSLAENLKRSGELMKNIARSDKEKLDKTRAHAEKNLGRMSREVTTLEKMLSAGAQCTCLLIFMVLTVSVVFVGMYIFMKVFPKG